MDVKLTALTFAILAGLAVPALADRGPGNMPKPPMPSFSELDADGNGAVTPEELEAFGNTRFDAADADGNGELTQEEMEAAALARFQEKLAYRTQVALAKLDTDSNGTVSKAEMDAKMKGPRPEQMFLRLDANKDGAISAEEFEQMAQMGPRMMPREGHHDDRGRDGGKAPWQH